MYASFCAEVWIFLLLFLVGWDWVSWYCGHYWPIVLVPAPDDRWWWLWRNWWNADWQGKPKFLEKTCPSTTLSTTKLIWLDPGLNPGRCKHIELITLTAYVIDRFDRMGNTASVFGRSWLYISHWRPAVMNYGSRGYPQSFRAEYWGNNSRNG
jgi:hypothetical protein